MRIGIVKKCFNKGKIVIGSDTNDVGTAGGIVGSSPETYDTLVCECFNLGDITSHMTGTKESIIGGICGRTFGSISSCYNRGKIIMKVNGEGWPNCGGITGRADSYQKSVCTLVNCYNTGNVDVEGGNEEHRTRRGSITGLIFKYDVIKNNFCYIYEDLKGFGEIYERLGDGIEDVKQYDDRDKLKEIANDLGADYRKDTRNINEGFPILAWQEEK